MRNIKEMDKRLDEREQEIIQLQQAKDNLQNDYQEAVDKINNMKLDIDQAQEIIIELQQENKQLKEDKKKARDYIKEHSEELHHSFDEPDWNYLLYCNRDELLEILGDKE